MQRNRSYNRRQFVTAATQTVAAAVMTGWVAKIHSAEPSPAPKSPQLIDAHTHFYDPTRPGGVPWPSPSDKRLYRRVLPKDYLALPVPRPVTGTIVVEASPWIEDNQWVLDLASKEPFILGFVGNLPLGTQEFAAHLKRFSANKKFRGIRLRDRRLAGLLEDSAFLSDLKLLAEYDLSLDLVGGKEILTFAEGLKTKFPTLRIVIDHLAGLRVDGQPPPADWLEKMKPLANAPHIYFKLSGLVEGTYNNDASAPRNPEFYAPTLGAMMRMFGSERLIYASNWPVSEQFAPLETVQGIITDYLRSQNQSAAEQILSLNAKTAYHLTP